jgi:hypothetical protein
MRGGNGKNTNFICSKIIQKLGNTKPMPNPRSVTHLLLSSSFVVLTKFNGLLMQFGQFLSHDITSQSFLDEFKVN